jgi:hypothetical protein
VFLAVWGALAVAPSYRDDWLLENLPVFVALPLAVGTYRRFRFSDRAYVQATAFALLHAAGSHYTYSEVPFGWWMARAFDLSRNHYDRLVPSGCSCARSPSWRARGARPRRPRVSRRRGGGGVEHSTGDRVGRGEHRRSGGRHRARHQGANGRTEGYAGVFGGLVAALAQLRRRRLRAADSMVEARVQRSVRAR